MKPGDSIIIREEDEFYIISDLILDTNGLRWSIEYPVEKENHYVDDEGRVRSIYENEDDDDEDEMF